MSENPMEQAAGQAAQTAVMSVRFLVTIAMAVSERQRKENPERAAQVERLRQLNEPGEDAAQRYAAMVREQFTDSNLSDALLNSEQWPQIANDLRSLDSAGIDVRAFLGDAGRIAERIAATIAPQPTPEQMVREHLGNRLADTLVNSERWPQIADEMRQMQAAGINMPRMLAAAAEPGAKVEATMTEAWKQHADRVERLEKETAPAPVRGTPPAKNENRRRGRRGDSSDRGAALAEMGLSTQENQKYIRMLRENVEDRHTAELLVVSRNWPQVAASMRDLESRRIDPGPRLARLPQVIAGQAASGGRISLTDAAQEALRHPAPTKPARRDAPTRPEVRWVPREPVGSYIPKPAQKDASARPTPKPAQKDASARPELHWVDLPGSTDLMEENDPANRTAKAEPDTSVRESPVKGAAPQPTEGGTVSPEQLRTAAHHVAGIKHGVNAETLRTGLGVDERQAHALVSEMSKRDIIGYDPVSDRYDTKAESKAAADLLVDGKEITAAQANKSVAASATSSTSQAPKARTAEPTADVRTTPAQAQTKGRTR